MPGGRVKGLLMHGSGFVEMLAREMSVAPAAIREDAQARAEDAQARATT